MDPVLNCDDLPLRVASGAEARASLTVHNTGQATDHFRFEVLGPAARWTRVEPRQVAGVEAGDHAAAELVVRPPTSAPRGPALLGVRAVSLVDPDRVAVVEGEVVVGSADGVDVAAAAVQAGGRHGGRYVLELTNAGAVPAEVLLSASDPRQELGFALAPAAVTVPPGDSERAYLTARPRRPRLAGRPLVHRFAVESRTPSGNRDRLPLEFEQRPVLGAAAAAGAVLLAVAVTVAAGVLAWPALRSAFAGEEAAPPSAAAPSASAPADEVQGHYVLWATFPIDDPGAQERAGTRRDELQGAGIEARVLDGRESDAIPDGFWVLVQDGFGSREQAQAVCDSNKDVAPACAVDEAG